MGQSKWPLHQKKKRGGGGREREKAKKETIKEL